jgi:hypothetical protein
MFVNESLRMARGCAITFNRFFVALFRQQCGEFHLLFRTTAFLKQKFEKPSAVPFVIIFYHYSTFSQTQTGAHCTVPFTGLLLESETGKE